MLLSNAPARPPCLPHARPAGKVWNGAKAAKGSRPEHMTTTATAAPRKTVKPALSKAPARPAKGPLATAAAAAKPMPHSKSAEPSGDDFLNMDTPDKNLAEF